MTEKAKMKILVIDDELSVRRLVRRILEKAGYLVVEASDGSGASGMVRQEQPDLVLLDMHMLRLDGIAALEEIRMVDRSIPIIMLSADNDDKRVQLALDNGASEFLAKPFDPEKLVAAVKARLAESRT
ncbi:MAG: response regulator [Elusimicrobiota bacterium]